LPIQNYQDIGEISMREQNYLYATAEKLHRQIQIKIGKFPSKATEIHLHFAAGKLSFSRSEIIIRRS